MRRPNALLEALVAARGSQGPELNAHDGIMPALLAYASETPDNVAAASLVRYRSDQGFVLARTGEPLGDVLRRTARPGEEYPPQCLADTVTVGRILFALAGPDVGRDLLELMLDLANSDDMPPVELRQRVRDAISNESLRLLGVALPKGWGFEPVTTLGGTRVRLALETADDRIDAAGLLNTTEDGGDPDGAAARRIATILSTAFAAGWYVPERFDS